MTTFPHDYNTKLTRCVIRIDDGMYDVTAFRDSHPGGAELLDLYNNADATDVFYAFHSEKAIAQVKRMRAKPVGPSDPQRDAISVNFEVFRKRLEAHGWFKRNWLADFFFVMFPCLALAALGTYLAHDHPLLAIVSLGVSMQQSGWIGHDYGHGRGDASYRLNRAFGAIMNGFSSSWWSHKHNTHHAFPNRLGVDSDVHNEPILHLFLPDKSRDVWYRKYQHYYYIFVYAFLYVSWRLQSILFVIGSRNKTEIVLMTIGYAWLATLPLHVVAGSILLGGWLVAIVVTSNHQPEPMLETTSKYNFVADQIVTTRGIACPDWITEYLFGGMQYQLEHHLFPTMPKYRYAAVRPLVKRFAEENGLEFKCSGMVDIMVRNYQVMKKFAE